MTQELISAQDDVVAMLRPAETVMDLARLGTLHPYRLSFMRTLVRKMMREDWQVKRARFDLCDDGYGTAVYTVETPDSFYSYIAFADELDPSRRSDRVIAEQWDITATLRAGSIDDGGIERLRENVPLQEKGRVDANCIVLTRANKSVRNFDYVLDCLADGKQPDSLKLAKVGYLYRTTAVYGSGKFGMADWQKVREEYSDFDHPFMAEMLACFLIREFSLDQAEHVAARRAPDSAVKLDDALKRYVGIGNATGLGMAPYLINHPLLIANWMEIRETALAAILARGVFDDARYSKLIALINQAALHLVEIATENEEQNALNSKLRAEMLALAEYLTAQRGQCSGWQEIERHVENTASMAAQELFHSILVELFPELVDNLENMLGVHEEYTLVPDMPLTALRDNIRSHYQWALDYDFTLENARKTFWYRSEEKMEPRLGERYAEPGEEREIMIGIAHSVHQCHESLQGHLTQFPASNVAQFVAAHPQHRRIVRRIQTMAKTRYGEIRANLLDKDVLPINLLRCKLSFFGVSKFDPRSRLWVRNTMFQGAPLRADLGQKFDDNWCFPIIPDQAARVNG